MDPIPCKGASEKWIGSKWIRSSLDPISCKRGLRFRDQVSVSMSNLVSEQRSEYYNGRQRSVGLRPSYFLSSKQPQ